MDPNATIRDILGRVAALIAEPVKSRAEWLDDWDQVVERVEALSGWLERGGFIPGEKKPE